MDVISISGCPLWHESLRKEVSAS